MYNPLVSIVIPVYNGSNYMREAIDSALAQTYSNIEVIVVNDGSKDDGATERIALSYGNKIRYFYKENGGSSSALNVGISNMNGEWFSWLSHDDLYLPDKISKQIEYIVSSKIDEVELPNNIFFAASELIDGQGNIISPFNRERALEFSKTISALPHNGYLISKPNVFYSYHGCSCLIHKSAFDKVGIFDEKLRLINDLDMWFRLYSANYKLHYIPELLVKGRIHAKQVSASVQFSCFNPEQDMFWERSYNWILDNCPEEKLLFSFGKCAYLKLRDSDGDRAFSHINMYTMKKNIFKITYKARARMRIVAKKIYLKLKHIA